MKPLNLIKIEDDEIYQELMAEYQDAKPEAVELCLRFMQMGAWLHLSQETIFAKHGLTRGRFSILMFLRCAPGRALTPSELADRARVTRGTMTQFIDALEKDGLAERRAETGDRRSLVVKLTAKGFELLQKVLPEHLQRLESVTEILSSKERSELQRLLEKLAGGQTLV